MTVNVATVGRLSVTGLVNKLRAAVGQEVIASEDVSGGTSYFSEKPAWLDAAKVVASIDERSSDADKMPIATVLQKAARLQPTEIIELVTTFIPAPGVDSHEKERPFGVVNPRGA